MKTLFKKIRTARKNALLRKIYADIMAKYNEGKTFYVTKSVIVKKYGKRAGDYFYSLFNMFDKAEWDYDLEGQVFYI